MSPRRRALAQLVVVLPVLAALSACGGSAPPEASAPASPEPTAAAVRAIDTPDCLPGGARAVVAGSEADPTIVVTLGDGSQGIVFAPQLGATFCQWADQLARYADQGYRVASFAWGEDGGASLEATVGVLRGEGAEDVALVGASKGAGVVAALADDLRPAPVGVIALSPGVEVEGHDATSAGSAYTGPLLVVASEADGSIRASESQQVARADDPSSYVQLPGSAHGVAILLASTGPQVLDQMDGFLAAAFGG